MFAGFDELPASHRRALLDATQVAIDTFLEDIVAVRQGDASSASFMPSHLPPKYITRYTPHFYREFLACVYAVSTKLRSPHSEALACTGEELALHALVETADVLLDEKGVAAEFDDFYDSAFEDVDFELLWDESLDGIEDTELAKIRGIANLRFDEWFIPFRDDEPVHPYLTGGAKNPKGKKRRGA